jgi:hypothetical protein
MPRILCSIFRPRRGCTTLLGSVKEGAVHVVLRALAEEDFEGGPGAVATAVGSDCERLYKGGAVAASRLPSVNAWLTKQQCMFPDVIESLAMGHLEKGDQMSAIITSEW